ncbi:MAG: hypothetical protein ACO1PI_14810 [Bacteroidota bacterium]
MIRILKHNSSLVNKPDYFDTSLHKGKRGQKTEKPEPLTEAQKQAIHSKLRSNVYSQYYGHYFYGALARP